MYITLTLIFCVLQTQLLDWGMISIEKQLSLRLSSAHAIELYVDPTIKRFEGLAL